MLHIIQNDPEVPPGGLLDHLSIPWQLHHPYTTGQLPEVDAISALIVLGGRWEPMMTTNIPFWLT